MKVRGVVEAAGDRCGPLPPAGAAMTSSATWDPWGQVLASAGPAVQVGYQGQGTDPITGQVSMGARFYRPPAGGFINQDTDPREEGGPAGPHNLHASAPDNPATLTALSRPPPHPTRGCRG